MSALLPPYLTDPEIWIDLLPVPLAAILLAALVALIRQDGTPYGHRVVIVASFSLLGFVIGDLTGQSREAAVPATIGAVLTLLGGAMVYLLGARGVSKQAFASAAVCVLALSLFFGTNWGSILREKADFNKKTARYRIILEEEDMKLRILRAQEHLPDPPPPPADPDKKPGS